MRQDEDFGGHVDFWLPREVESIGDLLEITPPRSDRAGLADFLFCNVGLHISFAVCLDDPVFSVGFGGLGLFGFDGYGLLTWYHPGSGRLRILCERLRKWPRRKGRTLARGA